MLNLLKSEFLKIRKDRVALVGLIVIVSFVVINLLITLALRNTFEGMGLNIYGRGLFASTFSINDVGIIVPIFVALLISREFSNGTIRNKIICGHKRLHVYFSMFISSFLFGLLLMVLASLINLVLGSIFFGFSDVAFSASELGSLLGIFATGVTVYSVFITFAIFIAMIVKSSGLSVVFALVFPFVALMIGAIGNVSTNQLVIDIFNIVPGQILQSLLNLEAKVLLIGIFSTLGWVLLMLIFGNILFHKNDLK
ncbi:MAG: ABC transporter permease [Erysipelotrichales bacterium]|nr:ABC transporter permease [Erysipelotrichales bacterium]